MSSKIEILERPENDRSYGQFLFAYKRFGNEFSHYIIAEDDYIPNLDNFDLILYNLMQQKACDYLCGKYGRTNINDPDHPQQNMGMVKASAFEKILSTDPNPTFYKNGDNDGQEFIMFGDLFAKNGLTIADYSDHYSVPYFDRYMRWFSESRNAETLFVPYQLLHHRAFTYKEDNENSIPDPDSHFLMDMTFEFKRNVFTITIDGSYAGFFRTYRNNNLLFIQAYPIDLKHGLPILERFVYENRMETVYTHIPPDKILADKMIRCRWQIINTGKMISLKKSYYEQAAANILT